MCVYLQGLLPGGVKSKQPNLNLLALLAAVQANTKDTEGKRSQQVTHSTSLGKGQILGSNSLFKLSLISRQGKKTPPGKNRLFKWPRGEISRCILAPLKPDPVTFPAQV